MIRIWNKHKQVNPHTKNFGGAGTPLRRKVFAMMSGGVDSSVAVALLKKRGFDVTGIFMKNWGDERGGDCQWMQDEADARRVAATLQIPFYVINFEKEYYEMVFEPFLKGIKKGITPNPDVFCNQYIKFGVFLERALALGADLVATGHYARVARKLKVKMSSTIPSECEKLKVFQLLKAKDETKDQTYFLYRLNQFQLSKTLFPIGEYEKSEVRAMAKEFGLPTFQKPDSQGICFVGEEPFEEFLSRYIAPREGAILDTKGKEIGRHRGAAFYTIGQRKGLKIGGLGAPLFIAEKRIESNTLVVASEHSSLLYSKRLAIADIHWISGIPPKFPFSCKTRIRYRQKLQSCVITKEHSALSVSFTKPQRAITPGQSVVFYGRNKVIGGGIIKKQFF